MHLIYLPIGLAITYWSAKEISKEYNYRLSINFPYDRNDFIWNRRMFIILPLCGFLTGLMAGLLGVGGGLFIAPLLLIMGMNAISTTSTSNFLMLFTASSTTIQFSLHVKLFNIGSNECSLWDNLCHVFDNWVFCWHFAYTLYLYENK
jgi:uncharacterized membrane protein YfcA